MAITNLVRAINGLAENPALPQRLTRRVAAQPNSEWAVAQRPDLPEDLIEEMLRGDHLTRHSIALNRHLAIDVRLRLAEDPDESVRVALVISTDNLVRAGAGDEVRAVYERLVGDPSAKVRRQVAESVCVPGDLRAMLANDPEDEVRVGLAARWTYAPEQVRRVLLTDPVAEVREAACPDSARWWPDPVPPKDLVPALLADPATRPGAVPFAELTPALARELAADPDYRVRRKLALRAELPEEVRAALAEDVSLSVRLNVFASEGTSAPMRAQLYAQLRQAPPHVDWSTADELEEAEFMRLAADEEWTVRRASPRIRGCRSRCWSGCFPTCWRRSSRALPLRRGCRYQRWKSFWILQSQRRAASPARTACRARSTVSVFSPTGAT